MQNRTFGSYLAAINWILISVMLCMHCMAVSIPSKKRIRSGHSAAMICAQCSCLFMGKQAAEVLWSSICRIADCAARVRLQRQSVDGCRLSWGGKGGLGGILSGLPQITLPELPDTLRPSRQQRSARFDVVFLDDWLRITKGDRGELRIFVRT
jgi:PAP_fibrillin